MSERVERILESVGEKVRQLLQPERFYAALYDPVREKIDFYLPADQAGKVAGPFLFNQPRPYHGATLLPDCAIAQESVLLFERDLPEELAEKGLSYWPDGKLPRSWIGAPMIFEDEVIGVLVAEHWQKPRAFGDSGLRVLTTVARQAAQAIEIVRQREQLERRIENLSAVEEMGRALTAAIESESKILELIYEHASKVMHTDNMYIALYDADAERIDFPLMYIDGEPAHTPSRQFAEKGEGRTEWIILHRQPLLILTEEESVAWYAQAGRGEYIEQPFASWVGVPLIGGQQILGVIATYHKTDDFVYDEQDQQVLTLIAGQAAVAIQNTRFFEQQILWGRQLEALYDIALNITSELDLNAVLRSIAENANKVLGADFSTLLVYNADLGHFEEGGIRAGTINVPPSIPEPSGHAAHVAQTQQLDFAEDAAQHDWTDQVFIEKYQVKSFAGVPLVYQGRTVGVLFVNFLATHRFSEQEKQLAGLLGNQAAVAIVNARLYTDMDQQVRERTQALQEERERASEAEKLAVIGHVSAEFAHRMNNLAGTIPVRVEAAKENLDPSSPREAKAIGVLEGISRDAQQLLQAAQEIRQSTEARAPEDVDIEKLAQVAIDEVTSSETKVGDKVAIRISSVPDLPKLHVERNRLRDTLVSIIRNGVQAIAGEGKVTVQIREAQYRYQPSIEIAVSDNGSGMADEVLPHIFDLFYTTKKGGLGFGLWRDRAFIRGLGGTIEVQSELGKGSTFTIKIPLAQNQGA
ncbi:MAG: GAF domain-containing protein [Chloroflexia bacterium]|nr:GAF domain-containing protein [Chloroflexia bacterium]